MYSKEYLEAKQEFWNCVRMAPFTLGISLFLAFKEWKPIMNAERRNQAQPIVQLQPQH